MGWVMGEGACRLRRWLVKGMSTPGEARFQWPSRRPVLHGTVPMAAQTLDLGGVTVSVDAPGHHTAKNCKFRKFPARESYKVIKDVSFAWVEPRRPFEVLH